MAAATPFRSAIKTLLFSDHDPTRRTSRYRSTLADNLSSTDSDPDGDLISRLSSISHRFLDRSPSPPPPPPVPGAKPWRNRPYHYHALMKVFSRAGNPDEVLRLLREMKESGCRPNLLCYSTAIHSLVISNRPSEAEALLDEMMLAGVSPDAVACTIFVKSYAFHKKKFDCAQAVIWSMVKKKGCEPDVVTYSTLIAGFCRAGRLGEAWRVVDLMLERKCAVNVHTYTPIIQLYCSQGRTSKGKRLLETMQRIGCAPDVVAYNVLIRGLCKAYNFSAVENLLKKSDADGWKPDGVTYNSYISGLCHAGRAGKAFEQLEVMLGKGLCPTGVTLSILFDCLCREMKVLEVKRLLDRSFVLGWYVGVHSYNTVMSRLGEIGLWLEVLKLFTGMVKKGVSPDAWTFNIVINSLCKAGKLFWAKFIGSSKGFVADSVTYNIFYRAFHVAGRIDEVHSLFSSMDMKISHDTIFYNTMVDCLCKEGKYFEAIYLVRSSDQRFPPDPVAHLTHGLVMGGKLREILRLFDDMLDQGLVPDGCIFSSLIKAFCKKGSCRSEKIDKVCLILDRMLQIK